MKITFQGWKVWRREHKKWVFTGHVISSFLKSNDGRLYLSPEHAEANGQAEAKRVHLDQHEGHRFHECVGMKLRLTPQYSRAGG